MQTGSPPSSTGTVASRLPNVPACIKSLSTIITSSLQPTLLSMRKRKAGSQVTTTAEPETIPSPDMPPRKQRRTRHLPIQSSAYYQGNEGSSPVQPNLKKLFDLYRDNPTGEPDQIGIEGAQRYLNDIKVELDEVAHFAVAELLQCPSIGEFNREEFVTGWRNVASSSNSCDSASRQTDYLNTVIRPKLAGDATYSKQVYRYAFKLAKTEQQRSVPMDSALEFWNLFFRKGKGGIEWNSPTTKWLDLWIEFYEGQVKRPVNKDLWNMVGELMLKTKQADGETLGWWTEDGAWPMAVDDFVAFVKAKRGDNMDTSQ